MKARRVLAHALAAIVLVGAPLPSLETCGQNPATPGGWRVIVVGKDRNGYFYVDVRNREGHRQHIRVDQNTYASCHVGDHWNTWGFCD